MLFDAHLILGYLIAKALLEVFQVKSSTYHDLPTLNWAGSSSRSRDVSNAASRLWRWYLQVPLEQRLMYWALACSVLPDIDVLITPLFGWHTVHRGATHSIFVMAAVAVGLAYFGKTVLQVPLHMSLAFTAIPLLSHPITDTAVNYGTKLLWPFSNALVTTGAITIWDLPLAIIMYSFLTASRLQLYRPIFLFGVFTATFILYIVIRRIIIYEAAIRVRGIDPSYDTRIWLMPSNFWPGFYYVLVQKFGSQAYIATTVTTELYYLRIIESLLYPRVLHVRLTPPMRSYFWDFNSEAMSTAIFDSLPTVVFIIGYHVVYYFLTRTNSTRRPSTPSFY